MPSHVKINGICIASMLIHCKTNDICKTLMLNLCKINGICRALALSYCKINGICIALMLNHCKINGICVALMLNRRSCRVFSNIFKIFVIFLDNLEYLHRLRVFIQKHPSRQPLWLEVAAGLMEPVDGGPWMGKAGRRALS